MNIPPKADQRKVLGLFFIKLKKTKRSETNRNFPFLKGGRGDFKILSASVNAALQFAVPFG